MMMMKAAKLGWAGPGAGQEQGGNRAGAEQSGRLTMCSCVVPTLFRTALLIFGRRIGLRYRALPLTADPVFTKP